MKAKYSPADLANLTARFIAAGARDPEGWARSQLAEGIPQLARYLALKDAWAEVIGDGDHKWIDSAVRQSAANPEEPYAGVGHALKRLLAAGASREDLAEVVRGMQAQLLFHLLYTFTAGDHPRTSDTEFEGLAWSLRAVDRDSGKQVYELSALHESMLELDPTGREMRPR